jgi:creatine kinase/arginine kinase
MPLAFPKFHPDATSLVTQHLTLAVYEQLAPLKTRTGFTLEAAIQSGLENPDSHIGIYAGDIDSYSLFAGIFDPIIHAYHAVDKTVEHRPGLEPIFLAPLDPDKAFILSSRVRVARNLSEFCFPCHIRSQDRIRVETAILDAVKTLPGKLAGSYLSFKTLGPVQLDAHLAQKQAFPRGDRFQEAAGINREFPDARGIFTSRDNRFRIWVNEEDHLRIIAMEASGDISAVFNRLCRGVNHLSTRLEFAVDKQYGFLTSCPTNIGTAMRAGVHIRLNKLEKNKPLLNKLVAQYQLQIRGTHGEKTSVEQGIFDISNKQRLGLPENRIIQNLHAGLTAIIAAEKSL